MSKKIVSGAVALFMMVVPMSAAALSMPDQFMLPQLPQNPTVQDLQAYVIRLTSLVTELIARNAQTPIPPVMTDRISCPVYMPALCASNEHLVGGTYLQNGCQGAPRCVPNSDTAATVALSVSPALGTAPLSVLATVSNLGSSNKYSIDFGDGAGGVICNQESGGVSNCGSSWSGSYVYQFPGTYVVKVSQVPGPTDGNCVGTDCWVRASARVVVTGGSTPTSGSSRVTFGSISGRTVSYSFASLPANTQLIFVNQTNGDRIYSVSAIASGSGEGAMTLPDNATAGAYVVRAQSYGTGVYVAQTVPFTLSGTTEGCVAPTITMPAAGYSLAISMAGQGQQIAATGNPQLSVTSLPWATLAGSVLTFNSLPVAGTYPIVITATNPCGTATRTFNVIVPQAVSVCPVYTIPLCPEGQSMVHELTTRDANNCEVPHWHCTISPIAKGTCTYSQGSSRFGDKATVAKAPVSIQIEGGQAACSAWCLSQGVMAYSYYTCAYNGSTVSMSDSASNVSNIAYEGEQQNTGTVAGVSVSLDQETFTADQRAQVAGALESLEGIVKWILAYFRPAASGDVAVTSTTTAPVPDVPKENRPMTAPSLPVQQAPTPTTTSSGAGAQVVGSSSTNTNVPAKGTLRASFKGVALPDVPNVTKRIAEALCRAEAVCTWNYEPITAIPTFGQPGDPTITLSKPVAGSNEKVELGGTYTFVLKDTSNTSGAVPAGMYRVYLAKVTTRNGPDLIYQGEITSAKRNAAGDIELTWSTHTQRQTAYSLVSDLIPAGLYYVGAVNITNGLKGSSSGSLTLLVQ